MKKIILFFWIISISIGVAAQSLLDTYQQGKVKLTPDKTYGVGNNFDEIWGNAQSRHNSLIVLSNGSVIVNTKGKHYRFTPNGKFEKEIILKNSSGKELQNRPIQGFINNQFFTNLDNMGKMICTDMEGKYVKTLTLDYMASDMVTMKDNKIAVVGWVIWKDRFRNFVSIVDYNTNKEKIVWDKFTDRNSTAFTASSNKMRQVSRAYIQEIRSFPRYGYSYFGVDRHIGKRPVIEFANNELVVALPSEDEIRFFDNQGNLKATKKIEWKANVISVEEQKRVLKEAIETHRKTALHITNGISEEDAQEARSRILKEKEELLSNIKTEITLPHLTSVIKDSDENLLFFEFPKKSGNNLFHVWIYKNDGKFACKSSFVCDEYNLSITSSRMVFHEGYLYALQSLKNEKTLRLVRFKLENE